MKRKQNDIMLLNKFLLIIIFLLKLAKSIIYAS